ncbi:YncE family protein [Cohnella panacarvi]|uniref:YncE family protein n=1 Tax=Cohnella panacarvi TaxID=400776 RepID=UPI00047E3FB0|nr:beta-propeller fold lactonase family protein [Cohnella panacarvi]
MIANLPRNYLIAVERGQRRISFVDADTLAVAYQLGIDGDLIDVTVSSDYRTAVATAYEPGRLFEIDLTQDPPSVVHQYASQTPLEDVSITADNRYAISVDGLQQAPQDMISYRLGADTAQLTASDAQAVAASPVSSDIILASRAPQGRVRRYSIDAGGALTDTGQEVTAGEFPVNLAYTPDGQFAFAADRQSNQIIVLATGQYLGETSRIASADEPQTIIVSADGDKVYVLSSQEVGIYAFDPVAQELTKTGTFLHHLAIPSYFGVDQMTLDANETKLFVAGSNQLEAFDLQGNPLGIVPGVEANGGLAAGIGGCRLPDNTLLVNTFGALIFLNQDLMSIIGDVDTNGSENVVISEDGNRAVLPAFIESRLLDVDLTTCPPSLKHIAPSPISLLSLSFTPDSRFVVGVPSSVNGQMVSYSLANQAVQSIQADAQAVAVSPDGSGFIMAARHDKGLARRYRIDAAGNLSDTGNEVIVGQLPMNVTYSPDGAFAFVPVWGDQEIVVLYTANPSYFGVTHRTPVIGRPQTVLVSKDGSKVYVLTTQEVQIFNFDPVAQRLTLSGGFPHNLTVVNIYGVRQMQLNSEENIVFLKTRVTQSLDGITGFTLSGTMLNQSNGFSRGGFAISNRA